MKQIAKVVIELTEDESKNLPELVYSFYVRSGMRWRLVEGPSWDNRTGLVTDLAKQFLDRKAADR